MTKIFRFFRSGLVLFAVLCAAQLAVPGSAPRAGEADIVAVQAVREAAGVWRFNVTVAHGDTGWDHYADRWQIVDPAGGVLGTRKLLHPHESEQPFTRSLGEQPFTRSLGGVRIPEDIRRVTLRAHDSRHGTGGREFTVELGR